MSFLTKDFLLSTASARTLYHDYAAGQPIVDYHCHLSPKEIWEDRSFENLSSIWLEGDHYKWRLMRANGTEERYITGDASDKEKFFAFASALERAIGNPMQHWCALELQNYFGCQQPLTTATAPAIWEHCQAFFDKGKITARRLLAQSNVCFVGTTDDPADSLEWHRKLRTDGVAGVTVAPTFRPDKALGMEKAGWQDYLVQLGRAADVNIRTLSDLKQALLHRMDAFEELGCRAADHGMEALVWRSQSVEKTNAVFAAALVGNTASAEQVEAFKTELLHFCAAEYTRRGWVMQLHYNCLRNPNSVMLDTLGPDTGFDCINTANGTAALAALLDALYSTDALPKTILYSLNHGDNAPIEALIGAFQKPGVRGYLQHGSAWWFNDTKTGMQEQLTSLSNLGILGNFVGMLTDSRSLLSYARHEYFRRILCQLVGGWMENGELAADMTLVGGLIQDICSNNAKTYFGL